MALELAHDPRIRKQIRRVFEREGIRSLDDLPEEPVPDGASASVIVMDDSYAGEDEVRHAVALLRLEPHLAECPILYLLRGDQVARTAPLKIWAAGVPLILSKPFKDAELAFALGRLISGDLGSNGVNFEPS